MDSVNKKILLLPGSYNSPSARFRILQFLNPLQKKGYSVTVRTPYPDRENRTKSGKLSILYKIHPKLAAFIRYLSARLMLIDVQRFDYVVTNRDIVPETSIHDLELRVIKKTNLIFDIDDGIHLTNRIKKLEKFIPLAHHVLAGNQNLATAYSKLSSNVSILPTVVAGVHPYSIENKKKSVFTIGWMGSSGTNQYLSMLKDPIENIAKKYPIELLIVSDIHPELNFMDVAMRFENWSLEHETTLLQKMDIGLMPLPNNSFEQFKCGAKAIQYMSVGIPALVSPVGANTTIVDHYITGFHCQTSDDWFHYIELLILDYKLRLEIGRQAVQKVNQYYTIDATLNTWDNLLK